jgi:hypothetical protein
MKLKIIFVSNLWALAAIFLYLSMEGKLCVWLRKVRSRQVSTRSSLGRWRIFADLPALRKNLFAVFPQLLLPPFWGEQWV